MTTSISLGGMEGIPGDGSRNPIPRYGTGSDAGATVAFLCSDGAEWITGQVTAETKPNTDVVTPNFKTLAKG